MESPSLRSREGDFPSNDQGKQLFQFPVTQSIRDAGTLAAKFQTTRPPPQLHVLQEASAIDFQHGAAVGKIVCPWPAGGEGLLADSTGLTRLRVLHRKARECASLGPERPLNHDSRYHTMKNDAVPTEPFLVNWRFRTIFS